MKVGHLIRAERIRQKMKQIVLARGICTPSYLSKIERNLIFPSEQIVTLLFNKLNIDVNMLQGNDQKTEVEFEKILMSSYKDVIIKRDKGFTEQQLHFLEEQTSLFENQSLFHTYQLITFRFRLILADNLDNLKKEIDDIGKMSKHFDSFQTYLFNVNQGLYYYTTKKIKKALEHLEDCLPLLDKILLDKWEIAEFDYILGAIYTADDRIFNSIDYIRRALEYFRENLLMKRVLECYILIGVTQKRSEQFQEALDSYLKAEQICDEFNFHNEKEMVYHNLGTLYGTMGNSEEAIQYFNKSLNFKKENQTKLISIMGLVVEYSKTNDHKLVDYWCDKGISLYLQLDDDNLTFYYHHFNFYKSLNSEQGLSEIIAIQAIEHFKKLQDHKHVHKYSIALADWYFYNRKYKLSSVYYQKANRYGYVYGKIEKWEDL